MFGKSWIRFLSGLRIFSLSHAGVMLINSPFTCLLLLTAFKDDKKLISFIALLLMNFDLILSDVPRINLHFIKGDLLFDYYKIYRELFVLRTAKRNPILMWEKKEIHELIFPWSSWLSILLVGAYA